MKFKQFAALPYRTSDANLKILLITTRKKRRWSVPKGWPIKRCAPFETAATEAYEEAGVRERSTGSRLVNSKNAGRRKGAQCSAPLAFFRFK